MKKIFIIFLVACLSFSNLFGCGCEDEDTSILYEELATSAYDSADKSLAASVDSFNSTLNEILDLVKTDEYLLNQSTKYHQIYYENSTFNAQNRQMLNAEIEKYITNWGELMSIDEHSKIGVEQKPSSSVHETVKQKEKESIDAEALEQVDKTGFLGKIKFVNTFFNNVLAKKSLRVMGFNKKDKFGIKINNTHTLNSLYAIELVSSGSTAIFLSQDDINALMGVGGKDNYLIWVLVKKNLSQKNYVLSYNKELITMASTRLGLELKKSHEMINILYDINMGNSFHVDKTKNSFVRNLDLTKDLSFKFIHDGFNKIISNKVLDNLEEYDLYQSIGYTDLKSVIKETNRLDNEGSRVFEEKTTEISELFKLKFEGAVYTYISFDSGGAKSLLHKKIKENKFLEGQKANQLKIYLDGIKDTSIVPIAINTTLLLKKNADEFSSESSVYSEIGNCMGCSFEKYTYSSFFRKNIIRYTPLIKINHAFSEVFDKSAIYDYICCVHKGESPEPQMFGVDHNGAFTNYNLKYITDEIETTREHIFIGGETGSTKTTFINAMKSQMIKFDWDTFQIGDMNGFKFREFDIKTSLRPFAQFVKKHNKGDIDILETDLNKFSYNLINCNLNEDGTLNKSDVGFCVETTSFILEARDRSLKVGLTFSEKSEYEGLIEDVYMNKKHEHITIGSLAEYQSDLADELYELGYKPSSSLHSIEEKEFQYLKKPTLNSVIKLLNKKYNDKDIENDETKYSVVKSLRSKLEAVAKLGARDNGSGKIIPGYYNRYEAFDLTSDKRWMLFDMDTIKGNDSDYGPIQWILLNRMIKQDMQDQLRLRDKGLDEPKIIYFMEEAHNVFDSEMFKKNDFFGKAAREWRSYNIILAVITQKSRHIPKEVYEAIETKFFLFAGAEALKQNNGEGKIVQIYGTKNEDGIKDLLGLSDKQIDLIMKVPMYTACAITDSGTFTIKLHTTEKMRKIFDNKYKQELEASFESI